MLAALPSFADLSCLSGYALIAVVCALLVTEEVGIPLFFAPGDLLLVVAGAAIPAANLNPLIVVVAPTRCSSAASRPDCVRTRRKPPGWCGCGGRHFWSACCPPWPCTRRSSWV